MSAEPIKTASMKWLVGILVMVLISVVGYSYSGTCDKVNEHERRIQAVERTSVKMDFIQVDLTEVKKDVKELIRRKQ